MQAFFLEQRFGIHDVAREAIWAKRRGTRSVAVYAVLDDIFLHDCNITFTFAPTILQEAHELAHLNPQVCFSFETPTLAQGACWLLLCYLRKLL